jgi:uncharacterized membrane protein YccC
LFLAFWLQLDNPFWAGTSAGLVCQPSLGASLRKANFRLIGTMIGAVAIVLMMAAFPQNRIGFILVLALWCGICGFAATLLQNFASYGAALAGYTAVIIASSAIADPTNTFLLAVARASEISLGIVCAGVVLSLSGRGTARARAATAIAKIAQETGLGMRATLFAAGGPPHESWPERRALIARAIALSALLDETAGESPDLRVRSGTLQAAVDGLFAALSGWRIAATHLESLPPEQAAVDAALALSALPPGPAIVMTAESSPAATRDRCREAAHAMMALQAPTPGIDIVMSGATRGLLGLDQALNGVALLVEPERAEDRLGEATVRVPDFMPAVINGVRSFTIILVLAGLWVFTAWPSGLSAMIFGAVIVLLISPSGDRAVHNALGFLWGTIFTAVMAAIAGFALLPGGEGFMHLAAVMGLFLVPMSALMALPWTSAPMGKAFFTAAVANFTPLLAPTNLASYNTIAFYNSTVAIAAGVGVGVLVMAIVPQLSPLHRAARLRWLTLRDLKRLASRRRPGRLAKWETLIFARIGAMPDAADAVERAQLVAALYVGDAVLRLRAMEERFGRIAEVDAALTAIAHGQGRAARRYLAAADAVVAARVTPHPALTMRARAAMLALNEALTRHANFFGAGSDFDAV